MTDAPWPDGIFEALKQRDVRHVAFVPDAGHSRLIERALDDDHIEATVLTTEEEGIALLAGAWLGGERGVLLMQSSGVGNCINMLSLTATCRFPLVMLVTMRGEWEEFNPWQGPMSRATQSSLEGLGVTVRRAEDAEAAVGLTAAALDQAFAGDQAVAVLLSQQLIGKKEWTR